MFDGTDRSSIELRLDDDPGAVFGAVPRHYANGIRRSIESTEIRYPTEFVGLSRCINGVRYADGVDARSASGEDCIVVIDGGL